MSSLRISLIQLTVSGNKDHILRNAVQQIKSAVIQHHPSIVILPESFNCPYSDEQTLRDSAEEIPSGITSSTLRQAAIDFRVFIVGGSIVERSRDKLYNTCCVWSPAGELVTKYRKIHLGDTNASEELAVVSESAMFTAGDQLVTFSVGSTKIGLGICWDMRFPEVAEGYRRLGCQLVIYPSLCDVQTGRLHWELIARSLALFVAFCPPARDEGARLVAYGHSLVADPWGRVCVEGGEREEIVVADLELGMIEEVGRKIPVLKRD